MQNKKAVWKLLKKKLEIGAILRELCKWKGVNTIEAEICPYYVHMLLQIPPKMSISSFMGFLKGKIRLKMVKSKIQIQKSRVLVQRILRGRIRKNAFKIEECIKNQLKEDELGEQLTFSNNDPFMGIK